MRGTRKAGRMSCETWKDEEVLKAHMASKHFTTLVPQIEALTKSGLKLEPLAPQDFVVSHRADPNIQECHESPGRSMKVLHRPRRFVASSCYAGSLEVDLRSQAELELSLHRVVLRRERNLLGKHRGRRLQVKLHVGRHHHTRLHGTHQSGRHLRVVVLP